MTVVLLALAGLRVKRVGNFILMSRYVIQMWGLTWATSGTTLVVLALVTLLARDLSEPKEWAYDAVSRAVGGVSARE
jgi:hypothetical protein